MGMISASPPILHRAILLCLRVFQEYLYLRRNVRLFIFRVFLVDISSHNIEGFQLQLPILCLFNRFSLHVAIQKAHASHLVNSISIEF